MITPPPLFPNLKKTIRQIVTKSPSEKRKILLSPVIDHLKIKHLKKESAQLNFICTHNSRRSQLAQIWAQTAAYCFGLDVQCYSGGVEVTAFNTTAVKALQSAGFRAKSHGTNNPVYHVYFSENEPPIKAFSKLYNDEENPSSEFAAIMTCDEADQNCPFIPGANLRIPVQYNDPKVYDNTKDAMEKYLETSNQIAVEMCFVMKQAVIPQ